MKFAKSVRTLIKKLPRTLANIEDAKQVLRSSGSVGANYIEANELLSRKDFLLRIKICHKEAKETAYWLKLIYSGDHATQHLSKEIATLVQEAIELTLIFNSIIIKSS